MGGYCEATATCGKDAILVAIIVTMVRVAVRGKAASLINSCSKGFGASRKLSQTLDDC